MGKFTMFGVVVSEKSANVWCWSTASPELWELRRDGLYVWRPAAGNMGGNWVRVADCQMLMGAIPFSLGWDSCRRAADDVHAAPCDNFRLLERGEE